MGVDEGMEGRNERMEMGSGGGRLLVEDFSAFYHQLKAFTPLQMSFQSLSKPPTPPPLTPLANISGLSNSQIEQHICEQQQYTNLCEPEPTDLDSLWSVGFSIPPQALHSTSRLQNYSLIVFVVSIFPSSCIVWVLLMGDGRRER